MVKPKNKHSLSHVRHDPAHCLAPGLFRALKPVTEFAAGKYDITRPKAAGAPPPTLLQTRHFYLLYSMAYFPANW